MKQTVNEYDFRRAFETSRPENFSYEGLGLLFEYFESLEDDIGEEIELDVIAICCDWAESSPEEIASDFNIEIDRFENHYKCPCGEEWTDTHSCACNDRCPSCNSEIEPFQSDELESFTDDLLEYLNDHTQVAGMTDAGTIVYCSF